MMLLFVDRSWICCARIHPMLSKSAVAYFGNAWTAGISGCSLLVYTVAKKREGKGESVAASPHTAFAIKALTSNYGAAVPASKPHEILWTKPRHGCYKLNTDATFHDNGTGDVGMVLLNNLGEAVASAASVLSYVLNAASAEAVALLKGIELLERLGCTHVTFESNSLELINACNGELDIYSPYSATLADCFAKAKMIEGATFTFCRREANQLAHQIAKHSYDNQLEFSWDGDPPSFILPLVINDLTLLNEQ